MHRNDEAELDEGYAAERDNNNNTVACEYYAVYSFHVVFPIEYRIMGVMQHYSKCAILLGFCIMFGFK